MRVLIAGAGGMLGQDLSDAARAAGHTPIALHRQALDITDLAADTAAIRAHSPHVIVNCAAFTDVDRAESEQARAHAVNALGADRLAQAAAEAGVQMLHVSTDYVFDGVAPLQPTGERRPYVESDATNPLSSYGKSKLAGELAVLHASARNLVVRTAWLFGVHRANFVETMLKLGSQRASVDVVDDQIGSPTWTGHLAPALIGLLARGVCGVVHLAGSGEVSWHRLAAETFRQQELPCEVRAVSTDQFPRAARRPAWSVLASERDEVIPMPDWRDGLAGYLAARAGIMRT